MEQLLLALQKAFAHAVERSRQFGEFIGAVRPEGKSEVAFLERVDPF